METEAHIMEIHELAELYGQDDIDLPELVFPLTYKLITKYQKEDKELLYILQDKDQYYIKTFCGGRKIRKVICLNEKIVIPQALQKHTIQWYHEIF